MTETTKTIKRTRRGGTRRRRAAMGVAAVALSAGIIAGGTVPANAIGLYYVHSSWIEASAWLTSSTNEGYFQAYARLGDTVKWGAYSAYNTDAYVSGANFTHQAILYRNGSVWKKAQS